MLEFIRKYAQGFIAWVIFGMLILAFGLWGIQSYFGPTASNDVAKVNDAQITTGDLATATQMYRARLRAMFGKNYNPEMFSKEMVQAQVLKSLIDQAVLTQAARKAGFRITDRQLGAAIRGRKEFRVGGKFNEKQYQMLLRNQGMSPARFERNMRRAMLIQQVDSGITRTAFVTDKALKSLLRLKDQKRDLGYMMVPAKRFTDRVKVTDAEISKRYNKNTDRFKTPARISIDYLDLSVDDLAKDIKSTDKQLHRYYQDHLAEFGTQELRHASHILVAVPKDADKEAVAKAKAKAEDILKKVKAGENFAKLAKTYSDDPGSAKQGGDLGFFTREDMAPAFAKAVFALKPGQVSGIVRTSFGFHIIKLLGVKPGKTKTFAQVKDQLAREYRHDKAEKRFYDMSEKLENLTYEHPNTLQDAAKALGLTIHSTGFFTRDNPKGIEVATHEKVRKAAFGDDVLNNDYNSLPINITPDRVVVLRKKTYKAPAVAPLKDVAEQIRKDIRRDKADEKAQALAQKIVKALEGGADPKKVADEHGLKWRRPGFVTRDDNKINLTLLQDVFKQPKPQGDKSVVGESELAQGNYGVFVVYGVKAGAASDVKQTQRKQLEQAQAGQAGEMEYLMMLKSLRDQADIKLNKKNL